MAVTKEKSQQNTNNKDLHLIPQNTEAEEAVLGAILAVAAGIMFHISFYELLPTAFSYPITRKKLLCFFVGVILMLFCHFFI